MAKVLDDRRSIRQLYCNKFYCSSTTQQIIRSGWRKGRRFRRNVRYRASENNSKNKSRSGSAFAVEHLRCDTEEPTYYNVESTQSKHFNPFLEKQNDIEPVSSPHGPPRKRDLAWPNDLLFSGTECSHRSRTRATAAKTQQLMKGVRKRMVTKQIPRDVAAVPDVHCGFVGILSPFMLARLGRMLWKNGHFRLMNTG